MLRTELKEFLDLEQGNHIVFDYKRQFNILAQYGSYHVNTDEKKANLYYVGLWESLSVHPLPLQTPKQQQAVKIILINDYKL
jgi:hypothetical protein